MKLIYIGRKYYLESGTSMSSIYHEGTWERSDWGFVQVALDQGENVEIRPATDQEVKKADQMLIETKKNWKKINA